MARPEHQHHEALPDDVLEFLPADEELSEPLEKSEEELAIRSRPDSPSRPIDDPALREDSSDIERTAPTSWFDDEQPDSPFATTEDDDEAAVDDLLVAQHYAFDDEDDEDDDEGAACAVTGDEDDEDDDA